MAIAVLSRLPRGYRRLFQVLALGGVIAVATTFVIGQSAPPLVDLATEPLYMNGAKAKGNLSIALSVEFPTVGQTYRDNFDSTKEYVGYFDPEGCYNYRPANGGLGAYFDWKQAAAGTGDCGGNGFNGNFMNWATSSAIDIMRYGLTGGNRVVDQSGGAGKTIVERAYLPDDFYRNGSYFSTKSISKATARLMVPTAVYNQIGGGSLFIFNCKNRMYLGDQDDTSGNCNSPFGVDADTGSNGHIIGEGNKNYYEIRNLVCDPSSATNRQMLYDPATKQWKGLCLKYGTGGNANWKPVGQFQVNSESLRISVFGYLNHDVNTRYGGVMRAPMKYLGPRAFDNNFNLVAGTNPRAEWDKDTGVFINDPQSGDATYGNQGFPKSGAIMYINKFGTLDPANLGNYKSYDPVSELYYETVRYIQGKQPTADAVSGLTNSIKDNFPVYTTWTDPFSGFVDATGDTPSCLRNSILTIADVFTHKDRSLPGNPTADGSADFVRANETSPTLNVPFWTKVVGGFESNTAVAYTDSLGRAQTTSGANPNTPYYDGGGSPARRDLRNLDTQTTGADGGSYGMAGLAYFINTQTFNSAYPKARVRTFTIDVNENRSSDDANFRHTRQLYLAAKYGGFDDRAADRTGNPYQPGSNVLWAGSDGEAQNYFLVSDAKKFLDSISEIFSRVVEETGSIAGGAISTTRLTAADSASVYQARFNPVANYWSGRLQKFPVSLSGTSTLVLGTNTTWEAGDLLTDRTRADNGRDRNIVIGPPKGQQGTSLPTNFTWTSLVSAHQTALNTTPDGTDTLGAKRVSWLRGDRRDEQSSTNRTGPFRPRDIVLGDIVNSGIVYVGKPSLTTAGSDFKTFFDTNKNRRSVLYVNANDGMLHGFYDDTGQEAFAYIPGFLAPKLSLLPDPDYVHTNFADATPAVGDAKVGSTWKTVLVSGVGGGGQGVYALDVTDPTAFSPSKVLWEFTDRDNAALGNVLGAPQILKFRVEGSSVASPTYKYFAVVASGVNNNAADGNQLASGNPSIFLLDLSFVPSSTSAWTEGTNYWRIELPQSNTTIAKGLVSFSSLKNPITGAVDTLYAGDMQGNLWKLDFSNLGVNSLVTSASTNFTTFNPVVSSGSRVPLFIAQVGTTPQPITGEPAILNSFGGGKILAFGTGKFLETNDTTVPLVPSATFYAVMDLGGTTAVTGTNIANGRSDLKAGTLSSSGVMSVPTFTWGTGTGQFEGWYVDFDATIAERQVSDITPVGGKLVFGSIYPTKGSCGEGGGRIFTLDPLTGNAISEESTVGVLAPPLVINLGATQLTRSDSTGRRRATETVGVIMQGSKGLKASSQTSSYSFMVGRASWREINNFQANKNAP